ncbi:MAG: hypothetical protein UT12_C0032G0008 [Candidatus Curtissbacteria bacterium GW2011_GWC2_38_9]|uniref:Peptidase M15C domain-containing protein n=1 Tax=Candidatus Curtissbacteria bacterium GW2011_GWC2_38_9 TaxID=1618414 RepID=A0A0G0NPR8_9BACT|nr:MAG: hypothetical protein UT12_C0032G0008 [Candidatus Curtissbacteria bacterium GW2011_GWC2_38_9]
MACLLVSKCLLGFRCKYDGKDRVSGRVLELSKEMGGLPTPRESAEQVGDRVVTKSGLDVTENLELGARRVLQIAQWFDAKEVVLKARSPSCGSGLIYDGTFSGTLKKGDGVATALLKKNGVRVISEEDFWIKHEIEMTFEEAIFGKAIPESILNNLEFVRLPFYSFEGEVRTGEMVVCRDVVRDVREIFTLLLTAQFPIEKMKPLSCYGWDDELSMEKNNTSCFNYRKIYRSDRISIHAFGLAIDINPFQNPYVAHDGSIHPKDSVYAHNKSGTITRDVVKLFESRGWRWGGRWNPPDFQHFEKPLPRLMGRVG